MSLADERRPAATAKELFSTARSADGGSRGLFFGETWWTTEQVGMAASSAAVFLAAHGARRGDRILLCLDNSASMRILEQTVLTGALVRVAVTPRLHPREIAAIAADCGAAIVCCNPAAADGLDDEIRALGMAIPVISFSDDGEGITPQELLADRSAALSWNPPTAEDIAILLYSSGTTGMPKGASVTNRAWIEQTNRTMSRIGPIGPDDTVLAVAPMAHFGGSIAIDCASYGAATVTMPTFSPRATLEAIAEHGITVLPLAPVMLSMLLDQPKELIARAARTLRSIPYGGSPIDPGRLLEAARLFPGLLHQFYGLSETMAPVASLSSGLHDRAVALADSGHIDEAILILSSAGIVAELTEVTLRDEAGDDVTTTASPESPGEVLVRSPMVTSGYWGRPDLTAAAFDEEGRVATGDVGWFDAAGRLHLVARRHDVIITGGFNVHPSEVERVILRMPGIRDIAVVGAPHPKWGESVHAEIVLDPGFGAGRDLESIAEAIRQISREHLAGYKTPRSIEFVTEIPRTALGKVDRVSIRKRLWAGELRDDKR